MGKTGEWGMGRAVRGRERGQHTTGRKESQNSVPRIYAGKKSILKCLSENLKINLTHGHKKKNQDKCVDLAPKETALLHQKQLG